MILTETHLSNAKNVEIHTFPIRHYYDQINNDHIIAIRQPTGMWLCISRFTGYIGHIFGCSGRNLFPTEKIISIFNNFAANRYRHTRDMTQICITDTEGHISIIHIDGDGNTQNTQPSIRQCKICNMGIWRSCGDIKYPNLPSRYITRYCTLLDKLCYEIDTKNDCPLNNKSVELLDDEYMDKIAKFPEYTKMGDSK